MTSERKSLSNNYDGEIVCGTCEELLVGITDGFALPNCWDYTPAELQIVFMEHLTECKGYRE